MADRRYEFTIEMKGETGNKTNPIAGSSKTESDSALAKGTSLGGNKIKAAGKVLTAVTVYSTAKNMAKQAVNHEISMVEMRTGSKELQQRASLNMQVLQETASFAGKAGVAFAANPVLGGLVVGAEIAQSVVSYNQTMDRINTARTIENIGLGMNYVRAGANGSRRG